MLWKEFRENFKWALLALIALVLAELYALTQQQLFNMYQEDLTPLCKSSFLMATTFGCEAVGLILGFLQILPEQRRDQWAALIHRPVERAVIYRGKALAGLLLYLFATVIPFLICVWYVSVPGHFASPFVPRTVYPGIADICAGSMFYFAALFTALRRGPWFGPRIFGLLAAFYSSVFVAESYHPLYVVIEAAVLMALALFTAAWSVMLSNGSFRVQPWLGRVAVLAVVFYGVCGLGHITESIVGVFQAPEYYFGNEYIVDVKGRVLQQVRSRGDMSVQYLDLAGRPVTDPELTKSSYRSQIGFSGLSSWIGDSHGQKRTVMDLGYRSGQTYLVAARGEVPDEAWYYLNREQYFVGYKSFTRARIGSIGSDGFRPGDASVQPFRQPMESEQYWQIPNFVKVGPSALHLDFDARQITTIFSRPDLFGVAPFTSYQNDSTLADWAGVALLHEARVIDKTGRLIATLPYHQDMDHFGRLSIAVLPTKDRFFLHYIASSWIDYRVAEHMPSFIEDMDRNGTVLHSYTLPPVPPMPGKRTWQQYISESLQAPVYNYGDLVYEKIGGLLGSERLRKQFDEETGPSWGYHRDILFRCTLTSLLLSLFTLLGARRAFFSWRRAFAWAAWVFGFNLAGLITFRLCADWPTLVPCPKCGKKRPIHLDPCPACGAGWPAPVREGTEIFDARETVAVV
jgi:hypothetical protein